MLQINEATLVQIAEAIREKTGGTALLTPRQMALAIRALKVISESTIGDEDVQIEQLLTEGTQIARVTIEDEETILYAPEVSAETIAEAAAGLLQEKAEAWRVLQEITVTGDWTETLPGAVWETIGGTRQDGWALTVTGDSAGAAFSLDEVRILLDGYAQEQGGQVTGYSSILLGSGYEARVDLTINAERTFTWQEGLYGSNNGYFPNNTTHAIMEVRRDPGTGTALVELRTAGNRSQAGSSGASVTGPTWTYNNEDKKGCALTGKISRITIDPGQMSSAARNNFRAGTKIRILGR